MLCCCQGPPVGEVVGEEAGTQGEGDQAAQAAAAVALRPPRETKGGEPSSLSPPPSSSCSLPTSPEGGGAETSDVTSALDSAAVNVYAFWCGWLLKKGSGKGMFGRRTWRRRFFRLEGTDFSYSAKESGAHSKGSVSVQGAEVLEIKVDDGAKYEHMFDLKLRKNEGEAFARVLHLRAQSSQELEAWLHVFEKIR